MEPQKLGLAQEYQASDHPWRGSLLPLERVALPKPITQSYLILRLQVSGLLRNPAGASSLATKAGSLDTGFTAWPSPPPTHPCHPGFSHRPAIYPADRKSTRLNSSN